MSGTTTPPPPLVGSGSVGVPVYLGLEEQPVPDPSPGVNSVLWSGAMGPTPPPDQRRQDLGLPPLPH